MLADNTPEGPRKSKAQRKMDALTEKQRKIAADILSAQTELERENAREKERRGADAFLAFVRRLDPRHLTLLENAILADSGEDKLHVGRIKEWLAGLATTPPVQHANGASDKTEVSAVGSSSDDGSNIRS